MSPVNTAASLAADFRALGLQPGTILMVHSSLGRVGWTQRGPATVIRALLEVLGRPAPW
jgi:aminoglycoside 3-N-acetyltransferase